MAKRKRLTPAQPTYLAPTPDAKPSPSLAGPSIGAAPIAQVASEASTHAALQELSGVLENARAKGLMIAELAVDAIDASHLVRDRLEQNPEEMAALMASLKARGQQTPIEVVAVDPRADGTTHGLISGWRRLTALRRLYQETSEPRFAQVLARVIEPGSAEDAYVAMVEENEIRVNLSHYERARIAVRALHEGVFANQKLALQGLFANATRARRSKIGSFVTLVEALDDMLFYPTAITERLGLSLVREMELDAGFAETLRQELALTDRPTAEVEVEVLMRTLAAAQAPAPVPPAPSDDASNQSLNKQAEPVSSPSATADSSAPVAKPQPRPRARSLSSTMAPGERLILNAGPGLRLGFSPDEKKIELMGDGVTDQLMEDLQDWLRRRQG
ncbi:ParB N-terminal domain-containing protein [Epibacterium ulvae]|uniref:ParB/RepB/Spo0J family partition protein n=1 Tax=Epibacterium ulvae TaxID=1156985 RepID=UPI001BFC5B43|nr:ParB N-terminal domain-containing protein [Epibacterium ulvae]MBT8154509.1 ParB N-terminal domain-containing protein [Epibacterium ulvae]